MKLNDSVVSEMATAGTRTWWVLAKMASYPSFTMTPQLGVGGCMPTPMKLRNASMKMAEGMAKVRVTMTGPRMLGTRCRRTTLPGLVPEARAAAM